MGSLIFITNFYDRVSGKLYAALGRRGGRVVGSDLQSGSASFRVNALLPVAESFRFALELRTHTSGLAAPQLMFSHWEVSDYKIKTELVQCRIIYNRLRKKLTTTRGVLRRFVGAFLLTE